MVDNYYNSDSGKMRVAQVITRMDWGGAPDVARLIAENLDRNKCEVTFISGKTEFPSWKTREFFKTSKCRIIIIPYLRREINLVWDAIAFLKLYFLFKKLQNILLHITRYDPRYLNIIITLQSDDTLTY